MERRLGGLPILSLGLFVAGALASHGAEVDPAAVLAELRALKARIAALEAQLAEAPAAPVSSPSGDTALPEPGVEASPAELGKRLDVDEARIEALAREVDEQKGLLQVQGERWERVWERSERTAPEVIKEALKDKWYERLRLGGYTQLRYNHILDSEGAALNVPNDRSVGGNESFSIRRGRLRFSGDVTSRLFLYAQADFAGSPGGGDWALQMRDLYGDISIDREGEYRVRLGQSKVPFGFVNMQSSQNRLNLERPDAINSAVEGERDIGAFFMWAPVEARLRYKNLTRQGLKGSGDYGVVTVGAYSGQGLNRSDRNGEPHYLVRLEYPFQTAGGKYYELGVQAYRGRFVVGTSPIATAAGNVPPVVDPNGPLDERVGITATWYPQPFGIEAEWNIGRGPELSADARRIDDRFLHGGYVQASYRVTGTALGEWFPFARWHFYDGGRKFAANAPSTHVNELDLGIEWSPIPELEVSVAYTHTFRRTNTRTAPYADAEGADRVGLQAQWNY